MILPYLRGISNFVNAPITWLLFVINLMVMSFSIEFGYLGQNVINKIYDDPLYLKAQGEFYSQFIRFNGSSYKPETINLAQLAIEKNDDEKFQILGGMAIRDELFLSQVNSFQFTGDEVLLHWWRNELKEISAMQSFHPSFAFGLNSSDVSLVKWLSYQFIHSGFIHFVGNMLFLLIFGSVLEPIIGGLALLICYLLSGMVAAGVFLVLSGVSPVPLIGASGAVSGLMSLFCLLFWSKSVRYVYFLFIPRRGYAGYVYLPGWITMALWILSDLAGYIGSVDQLGGIAHSAHLGGELAGVVAGASIFMIRKFIKLKEFENFPKAYPVGTTIN